MSFLISNAYAAAATTVTQPQGGLTQMLMIGGFVALLYVMIWLPQSRRVKEQRKLITSLAKNDEVITSSGILGKIVKIDGDFIILTIADSVDIRLQKSAISAVVPKGTAKSLS